MLSLLCSDLYSKKPITKGSSTLILSCKDFLLAVNDLVVDDFEMMHDEREYEWTVLDNGDIWNGDGKSCEYEDGDANGLYTLLHPLWSSTLFNFLAIFLAFVLLSWLAFDRFLFFGPKINVEISIK